MSQGLWAAGRLISGVLQGQALRGNHSMAKKKAASTKIRAARPSNGYAILNSLVGRIAVMNPDGTILFTNDAWIRWQVSTPPDPHRLQRTF